jgi:hypothetical protein
MNYYLLGKNKKPKGPYPLARLRDLWKAGKIPAGTLCCEKGGGEWLPIENVEAITDLPIADDTIGEPSTRPVFSSQLLLKLLFVCLAVLLLAGVSYQVLKHNTNPPFHSDDNGTMQHSEGLKIDMQPKDGKVQAGNNAIFSVSVEGDDLKYQWRKNGDEIKNATSSSYTIRNAHPSDEGKYTCLVGKKTGNLIGNSGLGSPKAGELISNSATLTVIVGTAVDEFKNLEGTEHDLCKNGAHEGKTIVVLQLYNSFSFNEATKALETKGFKVVHHKTPPPPENLRLELREACQIWVISTTKRLLNEQHIRVIKEFFERGKGVYIWGDNDPCNADALPLAIALLEVEIGGNSPGQQVVKKSLGPGKPGFITHQISTGLDNIYEGTTIATIGDSENIQPIMRGSAGNVVTAVYDRDGKRAVIDGGFTRLYPSYWNKTAGTARFVKNAACWLVNDKP